MDERILAQLCCFYSLGSPWALPDRIMGGLVHRMYRIHTARGQFAIKLLSRDALLEPATRYRLQQGERIAAMAAAAGLPAVVPLEIAGEFLQEVGGATVLVYPWIEGEILSSSPVGPRRASLIGSILGQMHRLPLRAAAMVPPVPQTFTRAEWARLAELAECAGDISAESLRPALPDLERWGLAYSQAKRALGERWVVSHGDLHQQNVLWTDEHTPWLIDWENAGWQQPAKEAMVCALEWAGFVEGVPDLATFRAFLQGYRCEFALTTDDALHGLDACFGNWLGWLRFCSQRALGILTKDPQEREEGARQVVGTLTTIRRVETLFPALRHACQE